MTNRLYYGDNLEVLRGFDDACVDLVYLDPPFNSNASYNVLFKQEGGPGAGRGADASIEAFDDEPVMLNSFQHPSTGSRPAREQGRGSIGRLADADAERLRAIDPGTGWCLSRPRP